MMSENTGGIQSVKTIIVTCMDLIFNGKKCQVFNFKDITAYKRLKKVEQTSRMLSLLNTTIHHEMLGPLKSNADFAEKLIAHFLQERNARFHEMA